MNLDTLRNEWAQRDAQLESALRLNARLLRETVIDKGRAEIDRRIPYGWFSIGTWMATLGLLGLFIADHAGQWRFLIPAFALLAWTVAEGALGFQGRVDIREIDYGRPLVEVQRHIEAIRISRLRAFQWMFLTGQVVWWAPFAIVVAAALGVDLYAIEPVRTALLVSVVVQLAFIPVALLALKGVARKFAGSRWLGFIADGIAGPDVAAARAFAEKLAAFEREG